MRVAIAVHDGRVSPVLDVARRLVVADADGGRELARSEVVLEGAAPLKRAAADVMRAFLDGRLRAGANICDH